MVFSARQTGHAVAEAGRVQKGWWLKLKRKLVCSVFVGGRTAARTQTSWIAICVRFKAGQNALDKGRAAGLTATSLGSEELMDELIAANADV